MKILFSLLFIIFSSMPAFSQTNKLESTGNVGIGTTNPAYPLHISADGGSADPLATLYLNSTTNHGGIVLNSALNKQSHLRFSENGSLQWQLRVANQSDPNFKLYSWGANADVMTWQYNTGNVGIGTTNPDSKLAVNGKIKSEEVQVQVVNGPDYVFDPDFELRSLEEVKVFIKKYKHLPEIPSAKKMEAEGINLGDMNMRLLKKIEELTLYQIELLERLEKLEAKSAKIDALKKELAEFKKSEE